jgi:class 3 adenylate cyclase
MSIVSTGTVTLLFTDIGGSIPLREQHSEAMKPVTVCHDIILHKAIVENSRQVFKRIGDAFEASFTMPAQALTAQHALALEAW